MATSRIARRNLAKTQLESKRNEASGQIGSFLLNEVAGLAEFAITATEGNRSSWDDFEAGAGALNVDTKLGNQSVGVQEKPSMLQKAFNPIKNFAKRNFTSADDIGGKEFVSDDNRTYTGADISFMGRMNKSKDPQVQMMLADIQKGGTSLTEALDIGQDIEGGISESDMQFKANESIKRRGMKNNRQSMGSMDSGTGTLSQLSGIESSMSTNTKGFFDKLNFDFTKENQTPDGNLFNKAPSKLDEGQREAIKTYTGPDGAELHYSTAGKVIYFDKNDNNKTVIIPPGSDEWKNLGLDDLEMANDKGME